MPRSDERWDVIGVGANSVDVVCLLPGCPQPSGAFAKMRIRTRHTLCGGQTATAVSTCASLGLRSKYVGVCGSDENGGRIRHALSCGRVDATDLIVRDAANQSAVILIDETTGERIVLWDRDDRLQLRDDELPEAALAAARIVHVDDVDEDAAIRAAGIARQAGADVSTDIDRVTPRTAELIGLATHAMFAQHVPAQLTGISDLEPSLRHLRRGYRGVLCVTLGDQGAVALDGEVFHRQPAFHVHAVDTTGAGDVFRGGFIYALINGQPIEHALRTANAAAAVSCTRLGALNGVPTREEIEALMTTET
ncbi:MAG TPA: PfkB family carbohydrate kinase [Vicinamibacterales bacterium]|jgi:sugar/nucleoside kinase (ribokinase family)|nr:PfkB family carbohydrate kinase [Vicinamibacterales bacterium]